MRINYLIAGLVVLVIGLAITGDWGSILMGIGVMILLFTIFFQENPQKDARYVQPAPSQSKPLKTERNSPKKYNGNPKEYNEPKPKYKNVNRAERELRAWDSQKNARKSRVKACPNCGSTNNPPDAQYCADCGTKL